LPIILASVLLSACVASRTTIQSSWADDAYFGPPLERVAVVALDDGTHCRNGCGATRE
jgi:hypothetical protein